MTDRTAGYIEPPRLLGEIQVARAEIAATIDHLGVVLARLSTITDSLTATRVARLQAEKDST
ncbi:MAG: hypothetical protein JNM13_15245 [Hyphomicrobiaceae bacterium]|nr:hypothetical protein [Hyphomicrobiaceae bacterium]